MSKHVEGLAHIGWTTNRQKTFEAFWCALIGFEKVHESEIPDEMTQALFDIEGGAYVARYKHPNIPVEIEIHIFADGIDPCNKQYNQDGLTHVCLQIDNREAFIESLPDLIKRDPRKEFLVVYDNPGGWQNIFLKDFEGNWVELREKL